MKNYDDYQNTLKLAYDEEERTWKVGPYKATIAMAPALAINGTHNINALTVTVVNNGHDASRRNFIISFDSVDYAKDGKPILYAKFSDAYGQLERNKKRLEQHLHAAIDISALRGLKPMAGEFERRAAGHSVGNNEIVF